MLMNITGSGEPFTFLDIEALAGGSIDMAGVTTIAVPGAGAGNARGIRLLADGIDSLIRSFNTDSVRQPGEQSVISDRSSRQQHDRLRRRRDVYRCPDYGDRNRYARLHFRRFAQQYNPVWHGHVASQHHQHGRCR